MEEQPPSRRPFLQDQGDVDSRGDSLRRQHSCANHKHVVGFSFGVRLWRKDQRRLMGLIQPVKCARQLNCALNPKELDSLGFGA